MRNPQSMANADNDARAPSIAAAAAARDPVRSQLGGDTNGSILSAVSGRPLIKASVDLASVRPITRSVHSARGRAGRGRHRDGVAETMVPAGEGSGYYFELMLPNCHGQRPDPQDRPLPTGGRKGLYQVASPRCKPRVRDRNEVTLLAL